MVLENGRSESRKVFENRDDVVWSQEWAHSRMSTSLQGSR